LAPQVATTTLLNDDTFKNTFEPNMPKKPLNVVRYLDERGIDAELIAVASRPPLCRSTYACVHGHAI